MVTALLQPRSRLAFDIETDGFKPTCVHCLELADVDTGAVYAYADQPGYAPIRHGLARLAAADQLIGHNIVAYDLPVLLKLYGLVIERHRVVDTLLLARVLFPDQRESDAAAGLPGHLAGKNSLESWGHRLGMLKGDFGKATDWREWSVAMQRYCQTDVVITVALWLRIMAVLHG